jgi:apyrase
VGVSEQDLLKYCFSAAYIVALLHDGLGLPMDDTK